MPSSGHINVESLTPFEVLARSVSRIHPLPRNTLRAIAILQLSCIQIRLRHHSRSPSSALLGTLIPQKPIQYP
jgi:hypothetical protein